jgi:cellulose synthase (UDP-forming)
MASTTHLRPAAAPTLSFPDGSLPRPETAGRKLLIRGWALASIAVTAVYLGWRLTGTIDLGWWWVAIPLFVVEVHNALGLVLYTVALWNLDPDAPPVAHDLERWKVAVLIPTYNEPTEILLPTIAAAVALLPAHETWVLDDGRRNAVRELAEQLGAQYLARPDNRNAKAGNLNYALERVEADIVAILDADHIPTAHFLTATLPYFEDEQLAFVQTPQDFYNLDSFEHERQSNGRTFNEEAVFYRVIAPAKTRWSAPFWCGTCALVRTSALRSVGGVSIDSVTEDIHTTIRMYRAGWTGLYHNEVLARGLAPEDATAYLLQRNRWAKGAMQVLRRENPLLGPGLNAGQRLAFLTTLFGWFDSWRTLAYMLIPVAVVLTGAVPINAPGLIFAPFFVTTLGMQFIALRLLARGHYPPILSLLFEVLRMPAVLPATLAVIAPGHDSRFRVTPKGRAEGSTKGNRARTEVPGLLSWLAVTCAFALAWFTASVFGLSPIHYSVPWAAIGAAFFIAANLGLVLAAIGRIRSSRFSANRRSSTRLPVEVSGQLLGAPCDVRDLSVTGARVVVSAAVAADPGSVWLSLDLDGTKVEFSCMLRRQTAVASGAWDLGLEFETGQEAEIARLAVALFHPAVPPVASGARRPLDTEAVWRSAAAA